MGAKIDNFVLRLNCSITPTILLTLSVVMVIISYLRTPVSCLNATRFKEDFCWGVGTFELPGRTVEDLVRRTDGADEKVFYTSTYQWAPLILFIQALIFYGPLCLLKIWDQGQITLMTSGLSNQAISNVDKKERIEKLAKYLTFSVNSHKIYGSVFIICEVLNLIISIVNMNFIDKYMGNFYSFLRNNSISFIQNNYEDRSNPLLTVFPKTILCSMLRSNRGGTVETEVHLCSVTVNSINEKVFTFLWFWFIIITCITILHFITRLIIFCVPHINLKLTMNKVKVNQSDFINVMKTLSKSDVFVLNLISKNIEQTSFQTLVEAIYWFIKGEHSYNDELEMIDKSAGY